MNDQKYLICDSAIPLHSKAYRDAVSQLFDSHSIPYQLFKDRYNKRDYFRAAIKAASASSINNVLFITMEEINGLHLIWERFRYWHPHKLKVFCFYYKYNNLQGLSLIHI